ncbi:MAG: SDR family NAD(P)-dependent oxidoreductase [Devosia sp.]|nr:SDR family NAD(P)-dependent oxidoreductase [Devosia sp.]
MPDLLAGRTALVTGASSGLGEHFAQILAKSGAKVIVTARRAERLEALAEKIGRDRCTIVAADLGTTVGIASLAPHLAQVDVLVNNAGVVSGGPAIDLGEADWDSQVDLNLKSSFLVAQLAARAMRAHGRGGSIINISSVLGMQPSANVLPYAVAKAGVIQLTKGLALEWAEFAVRVNAIAPGFFDTEMNHDMWDTDEGKALIEGIPQRRLGDHADLDGPLLLLASDASRYMTGSVLLVDGGYLLGRA